jgi:VanZ family protein
MRLPPWIGTLLIVLGVALVALATLWPIPGESHSEPAWCIVCDEDDIPNFVLNIVLFLPLGAGLRFRGVPPAAALVLLAGLTCGVEAAQFRLVPGRDASLGDVIANLLGGLAGSALAGSLPQATRGAKAE